MRIKTQDYNNVTVVEIQGDFDRDIVELFQNTVTGIVDKGKAKTGIVIDMSNVGFIDSGGLEQLLLIRDYCNKNNSHLRLAGLDENCAKILEITRLENQFDRYPELSEAVMSFV